MIKKGHLRILRRPLQTYEYRKLWDSCYPLLGIFYFSELIEFFLHVNEFLILLEKLDLFCNSACKGADSFPELFWKVNKFSGKNAVAIFVLFASLKTAEYPVAECFIEILVWYFVCRDEFIKFFYIFYIKGMQKISFFVTSPTNIVLSARRLIFSVFMFFYLMGTFTLYIFILKSMLYW